jgi:hypothetical protein
LTTPVARTTAQFHAQEVPEFGHLLPHFGNAGEARPVYFSNSLIRSIPVDFAERC